MPGTPNVFVGHLSGDILPAQDWDSNWSLTETSFLDHGAYIVSGLAVTIGTGLSVNVASGNAVIGADIAFASFVIPSLANTNTNHLWILQNGTGTSNTSGTPPANSAKLGTCVTAGGVVTSVNMGRTSGRQQFHQPQDLILGGPAAGTTSAGHPDALNLANWNATDIEGKSCFGVLPAGATTALSPPVTITLDDGNQNSVQTALTIGHTYNAGGGAAGIGVEFDMLVESSTNGTNKIAANLQATLTDLTPATATGKLALRVIANNAQVTPLTVATGDIRIPQATVASGQHGLLNIGSGGFDGSGGHFSGDTPGTLLAMNAPSGYSGTYIDVQVNGVRKFYLDQFGTLFRLSAPVGTANDGQLSIGDTFAAFDGSSGGHYVGSANGTYIAVNGASGFTGHLLNLQVNGVSQFIVGAGGVATVANKVATNGFQAAQSTKTTTYTLLTTDYTIFGDASGGSFTITLPTAASGTGQVYVIVKSVATANVLTLKGNGAELIQTAPGVSANTLAVTTFVQVQSNGTSWFEIG